MRIAFLLPSLVKTAPNIIAFNILNNIKSRCEKLEIFYFKEVEDSIETKLPCTLISPVKAFDFEGFDVLHVHLFAANVFVMNHRRKIKPVVVTTIHSFIKDDVYNNYPRGARIVISRIWYRSLRNHDHLVFLNNYMMESYRKKYPKSQLHFIYNGIVNPYPSMELPELEKSRLENWAAGRKIIGTTSLLTKLKGLQIIIEFLKTHPHFVWIALGSGNDEKRLKRLAEKAGVANRCKFVGFEPNTDGYYPLFDLFAFPSYSEGFGLSLLEAARSKLPVICSNIPVFKELYSEKEVAFFNLGDTQSFAKGIERLESDLKGYGDRLYNKFIEKYTAQKMANSYFELYLKITEKKH